jgi:hypothetical protein
MSKGSEKHRLIDMQPEIDRVLLEDENNRLQQEIDRLQHHNVELFDINLQLCEDKNILLKNTKQQQAEAADRIGQLQLAVRIERKRAEQLQTQIDQLQADKAVISQTAHGYLDKMEQQRKSGK